MTVMGRISKQRVHFTAREIEDRRGRLSAEHHRILMLAATNSPYGEIARSLGLSVGTVKSRLNRARIVMNALAAPVSP